MHFLYEFRSAIVPTLAKNSYLCFILVNSEAKQEIRLKDRSLAITASVRHTVHNCAQQHLNFLKRNLSNCTTPVKAAVYQTMVRPQLEYASIVWGPIYNSDIHKLEVSKEEQQDGC